MNNQQQQAYIQLMDQLLIQPRSVRVAANGHGYISSKDLALEIDFANLPATHPALEKNNYSETINTHFFDLTYDMDNLIDPFVDDTLLYGQSDMEKIQFYLARRGLVFNDQALAVKAFKFLKLFNVPFRDYNLKISKNEGQQILIKFYAKDTELQLILTTKSVLKRIL